MEQSLEQTALVDLAQFGPVAPHHLHTDEHHPVAAPGPAAAVAPPDGFRRDEAGVTLARATHAVAYGWQEELQEQRLELQLEVALDTPRRGDLTAQLGVDPVAQQGPRCGSPSPADPAPSARSDEVSERHYPLGAQRLRRGRGPVRPTCP